MNAPVTGVHPTAIVETGARIASGAIVGPYSVIGPEVEIAAGCRIGGAVGIAGHVSIVDHVEISGHTSVTKSIGKAGVYSGVYPFEPNRDWRRNAVQLRHLADMAKRLAALEAALEELTRSRS